MMFTDFTRLQTLDRWPLGFKTIFSLFYIVTLTDMATILVM